MQNYKWRNSVKNKFFSHARFVLTHKLEMRKKQRKNGGYHEETDNISI